MNSAAHPRPAETSCAIIGGGPAGLMAAEQLAAAGLAVTVYDRMKTVGRKFLMAGRGGLNLTHSEPLPVFLSRYGDAAPRLAPAIEAFAPNALRSWADELGQQTFVGTSGRVFPRDLKASPLLRAWIQSLEMNGVRFALSHRWHGWDQDGALVFTGPEQEKTIVKADAVILALGGGSWPKLGSDGQWVDILRAEHVAVTSLQPSNCGFIVPWSEHFSSRFAGVPLKPIVVTFRDKTIQGEAVVTDKGIEGSVIYALSSDLRDTIRDEGKAILSIDLRPGLTRDAILDRLSTPRRGQSATTYLKKVLGLSAVSIGLMHESVGGAALPLSPSALAALIKETRISLTATTSIERAISTSGGVARSELDATFMVKRRPGLFTIGEMVDWDAPTGGYLLQASFSMGFVAAQGVRHYLSTLQKVQKY